MSTDELQHAQYEDLLERQEQYTHIECGLCGRRHLADARGELLERCPEPQ